MGFDHLPCRGRNGVACLPWAYHQEPGLWILKCYGVPGFRELDDSLVSYEPAYKACNDCIVRDSEPFPDCVSSPGWNDGRIESGISRHPVAAAAAQDDSLVTGDDSRRDSLLPDRLTHAEDRMGQPSGRSFGEPEERSLR
jgi:hypothetical protein